MKNMITLTKALAFSLIVVVTMSSGVANVSHEDLVKIVNDQAKQIEQLKESRNDEIVSVVEEINEENSNPFGNIDIHGFISQGYMKSWNNNHLPNSKDGTFELNEIGINFSTQITENLRAGMQFFSRDFGDMGNHDIVVDWAFIDYLYDDALGFRVGKMKLPYGLYNETRDIDMLRTSIFLPKSIYDDSLRDLYVAIQGIGIYGNIDLGGMGDGSYSAQWGKNNYNTNEGLAKNYSDVGFLEVDDVSLGYMYNQQYIWNTPLDGLRLAATINVFDDLAATGPIVTDEYAMLGFAPGNYSEVVLNHFTRVIYSLEYTIDNLVLMGEYTKFEGDYVMNAENSFVPDLIALNEGPFNTGGWYTGASYRFNDLFEAGIYYSTTYDSDNKNNNDENVAISGRFDLNSNWIFKVEYQWIQGTRGLFASDNPEGYDEDEDSHMVALKTTISF